MLRRKPLIDADWLLGPAPPRPARHAVLWQAAGFVALVATLLAAWPIASSAYLQQFLQTTAVSWSAAAGDAPEHASIVALRSRLPASVPELVAIVARHEDAEVARQAAQVIERDVMAADAVAMGDLDIALSRPLEPLTASNRDLLQRLFARRYSQLREKPESVSPADLPQLIDAYAALLRGEVLPNRPAPQRFAVAAPAGDPGAYHDIDRTPPVAAALTARQVAPTGEVFPPLTGSLTASQFAADANPLLPLQMLSPEDSPVRSAPPAAMLAAVQPEPRQPTPHRPRPTIHTISYGSKPDSLSPPAAEAIPSGYLSSVEDAGLGGGFDPRTLRHTTNAELLDLLGTPDPEAAAAAMAELQRRGLSERQLSVAIELTRGSLEQRLAAIDHVVDGTFDDPVAWLVWLAGDSEEKVRGRAIRMLGSVDDETARKQLRLLAARESDPQLRRLIADLSGGRNGGRKAY